MAQRTAERDDFLASVIVTAVEGGIGYWASVSGYRWALADLGPDRLPAPEGWDGAHSFARVDVIERGDEAVTEASPRFEVTHDTIARGLRLIRESKVVDPEAGSTRDRTSIPYLGVHERREIIRAEREGDAGEIDASLADVIVQVAILGEVRYG